MRSPSSRFRMAGLSLIEIMIALVIGLLLLLGLVEVFSASRTAYQLSTGLARVQENGRFAMDYLQRDLRVAGHMGCVNDQARFLPENITLSRPALASTFLTATQQAAQDYTQAPRALRFNVGIEGYEARISGGGAATASGSAITLTTDPVLATSGAAWMGAGTNQPMPTDLFNDINSNGGPPVQNSDVVVLRYFNPTGAEMASFTPGTPATITIKGGQGTRLQDGVTNPGLFGIADCLNAAVFEASNSDIPSGGTTLQVNIASANKSGLQGGQTFVTGQAMVYRAESVVYYVGRNTAGNPSLYRLRYALAPNAAGPTVTKEELVEGIESLQLQYGQDSRTQFTQRPTGNIGSSATANLLTIPTDVVAPANSIESAWRRVGMVQVGLVARSPDRASATQRVAGKPLSALGVAVTAPDDGRFRAVYEDSVALRNRLFGN